MLKLMYITNQPTVAMIAEAAGVDRIFVDLEVFDKEKRQGGMNTVQAYALEIAHPFRTRKNYMEIKEKTLSLLNSSK